MRLLRYLLVFILLLPASAWAAIAELSGQRASDNGFNVDLKAKAYPGAITVNNMMLVGGVSYHPTQNTSIAVTDSLGGSAWTVKYYADTTNLNRTSYLAYKIADQAGTPTVTVDPNGTGNYICMVLGEFSGVHLTVPLDVDPGYLNGSGTTVSQNITTVAANALIVGVASNDNLRDFTPGGSYTQIGEDNTSESCNVEFRIVTTGTTYAVDWALDVGGGWTSQVISFAPAGAAPGSTIKHRVIQ